MKPLNILSFPPLEWPEAKARWNAAIERRDGEPLPSDDTAALDAAFAVLRKVFDDPPGKVRLNTRDDALGGDGSVKRLITDGEPTRQAETAENIADALFEFFIELGGGDTPSPGSVYHAWRAIIEFDRMRTLADEGQADGAGLAGFLAGVALGMVYANDHARGARHSYRIPITRRKNASEHRDAACVAGYNAEQDALKSGLNKRDAKSQRIDAMIASYQSAFDREGHNLTLSRSKASEIYSGWKKDKIPF